MSVMENTTMATKKMFASVEEMNARLKPEQILLVVNRYFEAKAKRDTYHKKYNARKKEMADAFRHLAEAQGMTVDEMLEKV